MTASSRGPVLRAWRQRAASSSSAVESGPPETARTRAEGIGERIKQRLRLGGGDRRRIVSSGHASVLARHPASRRPMHGETLRRTSPSDAQAASFSPSAASDCPSRRSASGALRGSLVFGRDREEGFRRVAVALTLEQAFTEPVGGVAGERSPGYLLRKLRKPSSGEGVVLAQHVSHRRVVFVAAASARAAAWRPRHRRHWDCRSGWPGAPPDGPIFARSSGAPAPRPPGAPTGSSAAAGGEIGDDMGDGAPAALTEPSVCGAPGAFGFCVGSNASPRRPGTPVVKTRWLRQRVCGRDCNAGRGAPFPARFLEAVVGVFLQAAELAFELLIAELQLLDHAL